MLGPLEVLDEGQAISIGGQQQRTVLGILVAWAGEPVSVDKMVGALWGESPPERARGTVQTYVSNLRGLIGDRIDFRSGGYVLEVEAESLDRLRFEALISEGRVLVDTDPALARRVLQDGLALWRGPPFADVDGHSVLRPVITELEEIRLAGLEARIEADLAVGLHLEVVGELESLCEEFPLREGFRRLHMLALYRAGRQAEALRAFQKTRKHLAEMGIEPSSELRELEQEILEHSSSLDPGAGARPRRVIPSVPRPRTKLVGRADEVARIEGLVDSYPLVTLTGIGGAGKTRLAIELGMRVEDHLPDGVFFVDLSSVEADQQVVREIGRQIGIPPNVYRDLAIDPLQELVMHLVDAEILLIMDNCEHLLDACAETIDVILTRCEDVSVLATSREPLGIDGEQVWLVSSLSLPDEENGRGGAAVDLLVDRITSIRSDFDVEGSRSQLRRIAHRLDGIPLALELAAPRIAHLGAAEVITRLDDRFDLLVGGKKRPERQQTLQATLDWSHDLLDETERSLFRRLAVFSGGFDLEAAENVCSDSDTGETIVDALGSLVDKSLMVVDYSDGKPRYRLLETVWVYAEEKLVTSGEAAETRTRHRDWYLQWLDRHPVYDAMGDLQIVEDLEVEYGNLRRAIEWSVARADWDAAARQLMYMLGLSYHHGHHEEVRNWAEDILDSAGIGTIPHSVARIGYDYTLITDRNVDEEAPRESQKQVLQAMQALPEDHPARMAAYGDLVTNSFVLSEPQQLLHWTREGQEHHARHIGSRWGESAFKVFEGMAHLLAGDFEAAVALLQQPFTDPGSGDLSPGWTPYHLAASALLAEDKTAARMIIEETNIDSSSPAPHVELMALAVAHITTRDLSAAREVTRKAVDTLRALRWAQPFALRELLVIFSLISLLEGDADTAMRHLAAARADTRNILVLLPAGAYMWRHYANMLKRELAPAVRRRLIEEGKELSVDEAIDEQLAVS